MANTPDGLDEAAGEVVLIGVCAQTGCSASQGGACAQGHPDPVACEHFEADETEPDEVEPDDTLVGEVASAPPGADPPIPARGRNRLQLSAEIVAVHTGDALTAQEATAVMAAHDTEVVVVLGDIGVGKTTLIAALYEQLARGPVAGWSFAGSRSLLGFEARSFLATAASGRTTEDTPRTSRSTDRIALHLALRDSGVTRHVLLGDVSGEHAHNLIRFNEPGDYQALFRVGTRLLVLVDGERLLTIAAQNAVLAEARTLLRAAIEVGDLRPGTPIELVVTKWDQCSDAPGVNDELERLLTAARDLWTPVALHRTAARPDGAGLAELFKLLLTRPAAPPPVPVTRPTSDRAAHRYTPNAGLSRRFIAAARNAS